MEQGRLSLPSFFRSCVRNFMRICRNERHNIYIHMYISVTRSARAAQPPRGPHWRRHQRQRNHACWLHLTPKSDRTIAQGLGDKLDVKPQKSINTSRTKSNDACKYLRVGSLTGGRELWNRCWSYCGIVFRGFVHQTQ